MQTREAIAFIRSCDVDDVPTAAKVREIFTAIFGRPPNVSDGNHYAQWSVLKDGDL